MSDHASPVRARRRTDILFGIGVLAAVAVVAWIVVTMQQLSADLRTSNEARDALARQVQSLGEKPVGGPPGSRGEPGRSVVGPAGPRGERGPAGDDGKTGKATNGKNGTDGAPGADSTVPGPQGPQGEPGADSTVPGPAGPQGEQGAPGADGRDGTDGRDGQTCPSGYSLQPLPSDPDFLACHRDSAPDNPSQSSTQSAAGLDPQRRQYP